MVQQLDAGVSKLVTSNMKEEVQRALSVKSIETLLGESNLELGKDPKTVREAKDRAVPGLFLISAIGKIEGALKKCQQEGSFDALKNVLAQGNLPRAQEIVAEIDSQAQRWETWIGSGMAVNKVQVDKGQVSLLQLSQEVARHFLFVAPSRCCAL